MDTSNWLSLLHFFTHLPNFESFFLLRTLKKTLSRNSKNLFHEIMTIIDKVITYRTLSKISVTIRNAFIVHLPVNNQISSTPQKIKLFLNNFS